MTRFDRYVLRETIFPLIVSLGIVTCLIITLQIQQQLGGVARVRMVSETILINVAKSIPQILALSIPIACALACSMTANRLSRDHEITALRIAGIPFHRIFRSLTVLGAIMSLLAVGLIDLAPRLGTNNTSFFNPAQETLFAGALPDASSKQLIAFSGSTRLDANRRLLMDVIVVKKAQITTATQGTYSDGLLSLKGAVVHHYTDNGNLKAETREPSLEIPIVLDFVSVPSLVGGDASTRTMSELISMVRAARHQGDLYKLHGLEASLWFRVALPCMCFAFACICPPLSIRFSVAGSFGGILISLLLVFVSWNTLLFLQALASSGVIHAAPAAFGLHIFLVIAAMVFYRWGE